jgi:hypothetical protein
LLISVVNVLVCPLRQWHSVEISRRRSVNRRTIKIMIKREIIKIVITPADPKSNNHGIDRGVIDDRF